MKNNFNYVVVGVDTPSYTTTSTCNERKHDFHFGGGFVVNGEPVYIREIIYNNPVTIVFWSDGTKTVAKCFEGDIYSPESGLAICTLKKLTSGKQVRELMDDWLPDLTDYPKSTTHVTLHDVRVRQNNR